MEKELNEFKIEVLTQLAVINSKLDGYNEVKKVASEAFNCSKQNIEDIKDIQDKQKWLLRTLIGAVLTGIVGIVFLYIKMGLGVN